MTAVYIFARNFVDIFNNFVDIVDLIKMELGFLVMLPLLYFTLVVICLLIYCFAGRN
jgi:hypothetical protein